MDKLKPHDVRFLNSMLEAHQNAKTPIESCAVTINTVLGLTGVELSESDRQRMLIGLTRLAHAIESDPEGITNKILDVPKTV